MEERQFCSVCSGSFPLRDWLLGPGILFGRAIVLDGFFGSVRSVQIRLVIDIVVRRFFVSDSQPDRSVQSEQSAQ